MKKLLFILLSVLLFSCNSQHSKNVVKEDNIAPRTGINDSLAKIGFRADTVKVISLNEFEGTFLYHKNCGQCHGPEGKGDGVVARKTDNCPAYDLSKEEKGDETIYFIILKGNDRMPPKENKLKEREIWVLIIHIKTFREPHL